MPFRAHLAGKKISPKKCIYHFQVKDKCLKKKTFKNSEISSQDLVIYHVFVQTTRSTIWLCLLFKMSKYFIFKNVCWFFCVSANQYLINSLRKPFILMTKFFVCLISIKSSRSRFKFNTSFKLVWCAAAIDEEVVRYVVNKKIDVSLREDLLFMVEWFLFFFCCGLLKKEMFVKNTRGSLMGLEVTPHFFSNSCWWGSNFELKMTWKLPS